MGLNNDVLIREISDKLQTFEKIRPLPGLDSNFSRECFIKQIVDSIRRIEYVNAIKSRPGSTPNPISFDPLKAAVWHKNQGNYDEAFWLTFLSIHFGKNKITGWSLVRDVYYGLGFDNPLWTWENIKENTNTFRQWLHENRANLQANGSFGNHRKYESLNPFSKNGTGETIESYVNWIIERDHITFMGKVGEEFEHDPRAMFKHLYKSMGNVARFGRTAKFDYLTMIGKLGLVNIEPDSTYIKEATGPLLGGRLLFGGTKDAPIKKKDLEVLIGNLDSHLGLFFGMQVMEDALCNWQKSPRMYKHFIG